LMLLATCRPLDVEPAGQSLRGLIPDLSVHRLCREIALASLSEAEVEEYLAVQSPGGGPPDGRPPPGLSALVHRHSEGNPLFMVAALEHMAKRNLLTRVGGRWQRGSAGCLASPRDGSPPRRGIGESRISPSAPRPQSHHDYAAGEFDGATRAAAKDFPVRARRRPGAQMIARLRE